ncbi:MAG: 16S rRNA (cytosine(1402)-N(4))-methyltransferase RsmH [Clostridia bacterium]|nr:16S rRNA (cytosine(1402)-N(4))-methyltransferase RsmH [Clostridia bacterium]
MEEVVFSHYSVLLNECVQGLNVRPNLSYVDCTTGGGGHSLEIAKRLSGSGRLICIDKDSDALCAARKRLMPYSDKITFVKSDFERLDAVLTELSVSNLGGVLADLGCSSYQFDTPERGFSYQFDAPLDMRMDKDAALSAYDVVNTYSEDKLRTILWEYGEEKFAGKIASVISGARELKPIETTAELAELIKRAIPPAAREGGPHPAKRSFQAIRIEVNGELQAIEPAIRTAIKRLVPSGRAVFISFHSLEDRIVKKTYADEAAGCVCPKDFPVCVCGKTPNIEIITKKPILPSAKELAENPRSCSAKLRIAEKL